MEPCVHYNIRRVDRLIGQIYDHALADAGIKTTQFTLLRALFSVGRSRLPEISERLLIDRTTLTRNFKLLEKEGWVSIEPGIDKRTRFIELTEAGHAKFNEARPIWEEAQQTVLERFGRDRWQELLGNLRQLVDSNLEPQQEAAAAS